MYKCLSKLKITLIIFVVFLTSCTQDKDDYNGEYPELYSTAIHSLLGTFGYGSSERRFDSQIAILEEDEYGRKLFSYYENTRISTYSLIINQKSDDEYTYFYPDYNFISNSENIFSEMEIEGLKKKNDWGKEIDVNKCDKRKITRNKATGQVSEKNLTELYKKALGNDASSSPTIKYFTSDKYGRSIYSGFGQFSSKRNAVMLFNPDGSYTENKCIMELPDLNNYQDELKAFKELNDWNEPWTS